MFCSETKKNESPRAWTVILIVVQLRACLTSQLYRSGCTLGGTGVHFFWSSSAVEAKELVSLTDQQSYLRLSLRPQYGLCARVILAMSTCSGAPSNQDQPGLLNSGMVRPVSIDHLAKMWIEKCKNDFHAADLLQESKKEHQNIF